MNEPAHRRGPDWQKYPRWVQYLPRVVGGVWVIGGLSYVLWTRILPGDLSTLAKFSQGGICVGGIAFAISGLWPFRGQDEVKSGDIGDFWSFVKAAPPEQEHLRHLHRTFRRSLAILLVTVLFMLMWGVVATLGLA